MRAAPVWTIDGSWLPDFWLPVEVSGLLGQLIGASEATIRSDVPQHPERWPELVGWYLLPGPLTDVRYRSFMGAGAEVFVRGGRLLLRFLSPLPALYRGLPLQPDDAGDPDVFRIDMSAFGGASQRIVFRRRPVSGVQGIALDLMPVSLPKQPAWTNPRRWAMGLLGTAGMATALAVRRRRTRT
jgi:hypothetical protein